MKLNFVHQTGTEIIGALQCWKILRFDSDWTWTGLGPGPVIAISFDLLTDRTGTELISALQCGRISFDLLTTGQGQKL